jgi:hypothetical protein
MIVEETITEENKEEDDDGPLKSSDLLMNPSKHQKRETILKS